MQRLDFTHDYTNRFMRGAVVCFLETYTLLIFTLLKNWLEHSTKPDVSHSAWFDYSKLPANLNTLPSALKPYFDVLCRQLKSHYLFKKLRPGVSVIIICSLICFRWISAGLTIIAFWVFSLSSIRMIAHRRWASAWKSLTYMLYSLEWKLFNCNCWVCTGAPLVPCP